MRILFYIFLLVAFIWTAPVFPQNAPNIIILNYHDFGPQVTAAPLLGFYWYQWENHGESDPSMAYNIKVVVYRNIPLSEAKKKYPIIKKKQQDYRYVEYAAALMYFDSVIKDLQTKDASTFLNLINELKRNKIRITETLGNQL